MLAHSPARIADDRVAKTKYSSEVLRVAHEIERYLLRCPEAGDTLNGILKFWLPRIRLEEAAANVLRGLDYLEKRKVVVRESVSRGGSVKESWIGGEHSLKDFYRLNPDRARGSRSRAGLQ